MNLSQFVMFPQAGEPSAVCNMCGCGVLFGESCDCMNKHERLLFDALNVKKRILSMPLDLTDAEVAALVNRSPGRVNKIRVKYRRKYRTNWFRPTRRAA